MDAVEGAVLCVMAVVAAICFFFAGDSRGKSQILHECKSFQSTVIEGEKFKCESVKS